MGRQGAVCDIGAPDRGPVLPDLGPRLSSIAARIPRGSVAGDIGSDHGYLPVWLVLTGRCPRVIATDSSAKALESTSRTVSGFGVGDLVDLRLGDGLEVIDPGETSAIVIAGMGGLTVTSILSRGIEIVNSQQVLALQPATETGAVRKWLMENHLSIVSEDLVEESGRFYQVIVVEPGRLSAGVQAGPTEIDDVALEIGPGLIDSRHPLLERYVRTKISECESVIRKMSGTVAARDPRILKWRDRMVRLEGILEWLRE